MNDFISWKDGDPSSPSSSSLDGTLFLSSCLIPRPTAWISVFPVEEEEEPIVSLVEGYGGASDRPPTLVVGSDALPPEVREGLRSNRVCCLSVATERELSQAQQQQQQQQHMSASASLHNNSSSGPAKTFSDANLTPCSPPSILSSSSLSSTPTTTNNHTNYFRRPPAVESSPVQMHCRLILDVPLYDDDDDDDDDDRSSMMLLQVDTYVLHGCILRKQSTLFPEKISLQGNPNVRRITAKIDCLLLRPLASCSKRGIFGKVTTIYHMARPRPKIINNNNDNNNDKTLSKSQQVINSCKPTTTTTTTRTPSSSFIELNEVSCNHIDWEHGDMWEIDNLMVAMDENDPKEGDGETISYTYRVDSHCPLGYNPMKQVVCPRFIGWISTYEPTSQNQIPHISPYSFFMMVAQGSRPMVAFAACPRQDEFTNVKKKDDNNSSGGGGGCCWKDAQRDAEQTGVFCVNVVSEELAWAMNASAAPLGKDLSEFHLMTSNHHHHHPPSNQPSPNLIPTHLPAPTISAPYVPQSPMFMECRYSQTVKIPDIMEGDSMYSLILGEVLNIHIRKDCFHKPGDIHSGLDLQKVRPVARLGYGQEYTVILETC